MTEKRKRIVSCLLSFVLGVGIGVGGYRVAEIIKTLSQPIELKQVSEELNGGAVLGESENNGLSLMSAKIMSSDYAVNGISEQAETAYTLTASVYPREFESAGVNWSIAFADASSTWAKNKTVTNYVTVTPTSDGALTATLTCLQAFGEQIIVTCASRNNTSVFATCTVDYQQKFEPVLTINDEVVEDNAYIPYEVDVYYQSFSSAIDFCFETDSEVYTIVSDTPIDFSTATVTVNYNDETNTHVLYGISADMGAACDKMSEDLTSELRAYGSLGTLITNVNLFYLSTVQGESLALTPSVSEGYFGILAETNKGYFSSSSYENLVGWTVTITVGDYVQTVHLYVDSVTNTSPSATNVTVNSDNVVF